LTTDSHEDAKLPSEATVEDAWAAEIKHRMAEYRAGRMTTVSWEEVRAHLHRHER
jgi:putative addiction module component (TIGR02574 family)